MTIANTLRRAGPFTCNGVTVSFPFTFKVFAESDLDVVEFDTTTKAETRKTLTTHYTVTLNADQDTTPGGSVTAVVAPPLGKLWTLLSAIPALQGTDLVGGGGFYPKTVEDALDRSIALLQQQEELQTRSLYLPVSLAVPGSNTSLPAPDGGKLLGWTAAGDTLQNYGPADSSALSVALAASSGSSLVNHIAAGAGVVPRSVQDKLRERITASDTGAVADFSTDNTAAVQLAINTLGTYGGTVYVNEGCKFNLKSLTFPARFNLDYRADDDLSSPGQASDIGSGERVLFSANSSYPADPTGAAVNEWRHTAPFHPGTVVDVRKDLTAAGAWLTPGQSLTEPVRASWNIADEQVGQFRVVYENYATNSNFSCVSIHGFRNIVRLNGVGTAAYASVPAVGTTITGNTSGAKGFVVEVAAGYTDVEWFSGKFVAGETIADNNETAGATVSSVGFTSTATAALAVDLLTGAWTLGDRPPGVGTELVNVSGNIKIVPTRGGSMHSPKTVTKPTMVFGGNPEVGSPHQLGIQYDPGLKTDAKRRLIVVPNDLSTWRGELVPVSAMAAFNSTLAVDTNAVNVASITNSATGQYDVLFTNAMVTSGLIVTTSKDGFYMKGYDVDPTFFATTGFSLKVWNGAGAAANLPAGAVVSFVVLGGDV